MRRLLGYDGDTRVPCALETRAFRQPASPDSRREQRGALRVRLRQLERGGGGGGGGGGRSATSAETQAETQRLLRFPVNAPSSAGREGGHVPLWLGRPAALAYGSCGASETGPPWTLGGVWGGDERETLVAPPTPAESDFPQIVQALPLVLSFYLLWPWRHTRGRSSRCSCRGHSGHSPEVRRLASC